MNSLSIYYFSGTGNARRVAKWIEQKANERNIPTSNNDIAALEQRTIPPLAEGQTVGIVGPTHGFNFPPILVYFIFRLPHSSHKNHAFLVNTRAGLKLGKYFLPGASGAALLFAALVLVLKGYKVVGMRSIDLPSNWISLHPGLKEKVVVSITERCQRITYQLADTLLSGKRCYRAFRDIVQDLLLTPISLLYFIMGRFIIAKSFYSSSACDSCNLCIKTCPIKAIKEVNGQPFWSYRCESCMRCMNTCPKKAIQTAHGFIFGAIYAIYATIIAFLYHLLAPYVDATNPSLGVSFLMFMVESAIVLLLLIVGYRVMHYIKRASIVKQLLEYTSLTRYHFWRRYYLKK